MHWQQKESQGKSPFFIGHKVGNIVTKDVEKAGIFNASFASSLIVKLVILRPAVPLGW